MKEANIYENDEFTRKNQWIIYKELNLKPVLSFALFIRCEVEIVA